jgi:phage gp29-like protein
MAPAGEVPPLRGDRRGGAAVKFWSRFRGAEKPARPETAELGVTGTPILGGWLRDLGEYNADLTGLLGYQVYERMRRSDGQVAATLMGMKLPIRSAEWTVVEPEDATPVEKEAAVLVRECLFECVDFDAAIENALLMLDFGAAVHEDVYLIDGNRVRLKKLAARLPLTFNRWLVGEGEDLAALEQTGYAGGQYKTVEVPASKLALFTFQQEGANFAGRSVLRPMYQHWYIKSALYKIDAIAIERNGMGIPWIKMGPDAKAEDRKTAFEWLEKLSVHEKAAILLPPAWEFGLEGVKGTTRDPKESIAHHNVAISMAGLAQFMMLGQTESGNRALGQTMADFFYLGLQATANRIGRVLTLTTVKRLVEFNFGTEVRVPRVAAQQILSLQFESVVQALKELAGAGVDAVQPDDELEAWMRRKMGAPEAGTPRARRAGPAEKQPQINADERRLREGAEGRKGGQGGCPNRSLSSRAGWKTASDPDGGGAAGIRRPPRGAERFMALREIVSELDGGRDEIAAALRGARSRVEAEIVNKLVNAPVRTMHRVSVAPDEKVIEAIEVVLQGVSEFGFEQVEGERDRQRSGKAPSDAAQVRAGEQKKRRAKREPLGVYADATVAEFTNVLTERAANVVLDLSRRAGTLTKGEILVEAARRLAEQSDRWIDGVAAKGTNSAFADGRAEGYREYADEIDSVEYSSLLDLNTCPACEAADGSTAKTPDGLASTPNPDCLGGDKCRCVHVFVFGEEGSNRR